MSTLLVNREEDSVVIAMGEVQMSCLLSGQALCALHSWE